MKTSLDCMPCFVRQALDASRLVTNDETVHEAVVRNVLATALNMDMRVSPVTMGKHIHRRIRELTGQADPYLAKKDQFNKLALSLLPEMRERVEGSADPLETAVRLAIAGNIIDFGVRSDIDDVHLHESIEHALTAPVEGDVKDLAAAVAEAKDILYLADNAGEIVFDRLLIEQLPREKVTVAVKASPVINDATMVDAEAAGLTKMVEVIDNGDDAPGTILGTCSASFRRRFDQAGLVLAKGQGNYESLSEVQKDVFFILKAKCSVIAEDIGCAVGSLVLRRSKRL